MNRRLRERVAAIKSDNSRRGKNCDYPYTVKYFVKGQLSQYLFWFIDYAATEDEDTHYSARHCGFIWMERVLCYDIAFYCVLYGYNY